MAQIQIYVHCYYSFPRIRGNRILPSTGANEYSLSSQPRYSHLFQECETFLLDEFKMRFPDAGGLAYVLNGGELPHLAY